MKHTIPSSQLILDIANPAIIDIFPGVSSRVFPIDLLLAAGAVPSPSQLIKPNHGGCGRKGWIPQIHINHYRCEGNSLKLSESPIS